ncbi:MAG: hypothetical protein K2X07_11150 [Caulobacteraceae bacterium]|nr:hypothetical protein [Caulobacteraceae bacterium]
MRRFRLLIAGCLAPLVTLAGAAAAQDRPVEPEATRVDDIIVRGEPLRDQVSTFVDDVIEPPRGRGIARWSDRGGVCVGVVNLRPEAAQTMADRVSEIADGLGLPIGEPGCSPNILVIATDDAATLAKGLVERSPNAFRPDYAGAAGTVRDLRAFTDSDRAVRWWHVMMPVHEDSGAPAVRLPGYESAPMISRMAGRLSTPVRNVMMRAYVIVDVDQIEDLTFRQLSDYVAMVAFAQIDPDADVANFGTILNVVDDPAVAQEMTEWDHAFLAALYGTELRQSSPNAQAGAVAALMYRDRRDAAEDEAEAPQ